MKRYELLNQVLEGKLTLAAAAPALGVSYRHAKRLKGKVAQGGLAALAHGNRGRSPSNKRDDELRRQVLALSRQRYGEFNDTHLAEVLAEREVQTFLRSVIAGHDATIFFTTHDMEEADRLCHRIGIMSEGKKIAEGTSDQLKAQVRSEKLPEPTLEEVFIELTGKSLEDEEEQD